MDDIEVRNLLTDVTDVMKSLVSSTMAPILIRLDAFEKRLEALPVPKDGKDADVDAIVETVVARTSDALQQVNNAFEVIRTSFAGDVVKLHDEIAEVGTSLEAKIPAPIDPIAIAGEVREKFTNDFLDLRRMVDAIPEHPGLDEVRHMISEAIAEAPKPVADPDLIKTLVVEEVAKIPPAAAGRDADPEIIKTLVAEAVAAIPAAKDGETPAIETIKALVEEVVAAIPPALDGKDADPELVKTMVAEAVTEAVAALPVPVNGKDADPEVMKTAVQMVVAEELSIAIEKLPKPIDGKDVDPQTVEILVTQKVNEAVAALPQPVDGKDVDPEVVKTMIGDAVAIAVDALPPAPAGKDADPEVVKQLVIEAVAAIPVAKDGVSVTLEDVAPMIITEVEKAVAAIPAAKDGADAVVDMGAVETIVKSSVADAVAALPVPIDGKDVDIEVVKTLVAETVSAAVATLPVPADGKDADVESLKVFIRDEVGTVVAALPVPENGKDVDPEVVNALVVSTVSSAIAAMPSEAELKGFIHEEITEAVGAIAIPTPVDGKDADPEIIKTMVSEAVAAMPAPQNGKDADMDTVKSYIDEAVASLPKPADGKDVDPAIIEKMVEDAVAKIPAATDGKSVDPAEVKAMVDEAVSAIPVPKDGKDADPVVIKSMVDEAVAAIPPAPAGKDADPAAVESLIGEIVAKTVIPEIVEIRGVLDAVIPELKVLGGKLGEELADLVDKAVVQLPKPASIEEIKAIVQDTVDAIPPAQAGKDADPELIEQMVANAVVTAVATIPVPKDGVSVAEAVIDNSGELNFIMGDGRVLKMGKIIGKDADPEQISEMVRTEIAKLPVPANGKDIDPAEVKQLVDEAIAAIPAPEAYKPNDADFAAIAERVAEKIPAPKDGTSITIADVTPVIDEAVTKAVSAIPVPKDAVGLTGALIDLDGRLILTLSDGTTKELSTVVGKSADLNEIQQFITDKIAEIKPKDGLDGLSFADFEFDVEHDGERTFTFKWMNHDKEIVRSLTLPITLDRGVYREGQEYQKGDGVTWAGSYWYAQEATTAKPGDGSKSWRLAVKRGQDGKPGGAPQQPQKTGPLKLR